MTQVAGFNFLNLDLETSTRLIVDLCLASPSAPADIHFLCASSIYASETNPKVKQLFNDATHLFPDGKWIAISAALQRKKLFQVRGPSLFLEVLDKGRSKRLKHYFIGPSNQSISNLVNKICETFPGVNIVGSFVPPMGDMNAAQKIELEKSISKSQPDLVWIGISTPRQDFEARRISEQHSIPVIAVGAAFDFASGAIPESPIWMRKIGFEWLFRLYSEPRRLWKRYLIGNLYFIIAVIKNWR